MCYYRYVAALAQLVEQFIRNEKVASSNPASGTRRAYASVRNYD